MSFENSWALTLNLWGLHHSGLIKFVGDDLVFALTLFAAGLFLWDEVSSNRNRTLTLSNLKGLIARSIAEYALPVSIAVAISEVLSAEFIRQRPFISLRGVHLVFPHSADGGMPSHHVLFMVAVAICVRVRHKLTGGLLIVVSLISGAARVAAGIHYPSDIVVGALLGAFIVLSYYRLILPRFTRLYKF